MKNRLFTIAAMSVCFGINAQVGINTNQGQATLDVVGFPANSTKMDGIIAPRLTETELNKKTYGSSQTGALVYVTLADIAPAGQTINVTAPGYYYFDGTVWVKVSSGSASGTVTGFSSGNLSPLFTTTVTNPSTTPALAFALSNAPANTIFGNNTGSAAAPAYFTASALPLNGDVTGTLGATTVVKINGSPLGTTTGATNGQVLAFNGTNWAPLTLAAQPTDWHITGNTGTTATTAALGTAISSGNFIGTADAQNLVLATSNNVKGILDTNGTLRGGNASTAGPYASFVWGSNNTLADTTMSSSIVLGRDNTVSALAANTPGAAIGYNNYAINGAKAIGNNNGVRLSDGSIQNLNGANALAFGNYNYGNGFSFGNQNSSSGYAIGTGNTVASNGYAFGNANTANATRAMVFGISGTAGVGDQTVYANTSHVFFGQGNATTTIVGINMAPTAAAASGAAIQLKGIASAAGAACTSAEEGAIRYNITIHAHEGCNGTIWKAF